MRQVTIHRRLVALNIALLAVLAFLSFAGEETSAQPGTDPPVRARGDYTMVSGRIQGATTHAVYIVDGTNQEVLALLWDRGTMRLKGLGYRNMATDLAEQQQGR